MSKEIEPTEGFVSASEKGRSGAFFVACGIFLSRIFGLVRERVFAHYFGNSAVADAFKAAVRIPNILQNLFGEGVLSGSFIPTYARLVGERDSQRAREVASAVFLLLLLVISCAVGLGVIFADPLVDILAPGFAAEKRALTVSLTRILFIATGILVLSAWCLGVLNSHGKFLLSYSAPVLWNIVIICTLVFYGMNQQEDLVIYAAWGFVLGSMAQFFVQLPFTFRILGKFRFWLGAGDKEVLNVVKNFFPMLFSRGVVQISAYVDSVIASLLPTGAVATLAYMQTIYLLPIGLFGMSVSAAELPLMSQASGEQSEISAKLRLRLEVGFQQIAFFIIPTAVCFIVLGDLAIAALFQTGQFSAEDTNSVWYVLIAATIGLCSATWSRLLASSFYALRDTKTPLRYSVIRVFLSILFGVITALYFPDYFGLSRWWGLVGLMLASAICSWVEFVLLWRALVRKVGKWPLHSRWLLLNFVLSLVVALSARKLIIDFGGALSPLVKGLLALGLYGILFFIAAVLLRFPQAGRIFSRLRS